VSQFSHNWKCIQINNRASDTFDKNDDTDGLEWVSVEESLLILDSHICALPFEITDHDCDCDLYQNDGGIFYYVNHSMDILVASAALKILWLVTNS
jgi:hypothetical protein